VEPAEPDEPYWTTVDPLDGTQAFAKRAPHGFSVTFSLVESGRTVAAYVGDVMTGML
jgi:fructose-1,6-bisphosphatase/inositol monophosphatase family enzyme